MDEVALDQPLWWLGGSRHQDLYTEPLPQWPAALPGGWDRVQRREAELLEPARWITAWHLLQDEVENRELLDTPDGTPPPALLLGDRCRALASGPYRDNRSARWAPGVEYATKGLNWAASELRAGLWSPGPAARHAGAVLHPSLIAAPDTPELVGKTAWIQRAVRLTHLQTVIDTVRAHHGQAGELDSHPSRPFGSALAATAAALEEIGPTVRELETLWAQRETGIALWERAHVPVAVREHIVALEQLLRILRDLSFDMNVDPDEPH
ncbi:hypothetical protein ACFUT3_31690 [Streptomyces cinereoruber]|uniref:hypothetical protein n=1 Tax=Streptomyces cinereoruber TaxID=67260 RepID=UPI00362BE65F